VLSDDTLAELYAEYGSRLYRYALLILMDAASAEDAVQEVFCNVVRVRTSKPGVVTIPYVFRALRNECYTALRKRRGESPGVTLLEAASPEASEEERLVLNDALARLPPEQREVVYLKVFEGMTFQEIAVVCDTNANTAASRHRYALDALRRVMRPAESKE
jgi:RNA polymerase sigma-70 factor (ECF subfamily)